jgi:hypothetical protein
VSKVYVINDLNRNFDDAKRFGELVITTTGRAPIFKPDIVTNMLKDGLKDFNIDEDYLLVCGPPVMCMISTMILAKHDKPIKILIYDVKEQKYFNRHITL